MQSANPILALNWTMKRKTNIALLFFSRNPRAEASAKKWFASAHGSANLQLATSLFRQTRNLLTESGLPVYHFHEGNQQGLTFGEKIAHAFDAIFQKGYDAVMAVGNDTPELDNLDWDRVLQQLEVGRSVLGPTRRKGAYLIGLHQSAFDYQAFATLPWQSNQLLTALEDYLAFRSKACYSLPVLRDINTLGDLKEVINSSGLSDFLKSLFRMLLGMIPGDTFYKSPVLQSDSAYLSPSLRAPPLSL